ncbi:hypothetical protein [Arthrobacter sp. AL12]|nr:hypothetical protein [Arthrobacter sp. AL12]MDI3210712.1 hypothetical protein [Arthrobacter sp. AL12]
MPSRWSGRDTQIPSTAAMGGLLASDAAVGLLIPATRRPRNPVRG